MRIAARAPNHLGDGVMALPALEALARRGALTIYAPPWAADLYRDVPARLAPRGPMKGDVAVLFAPSLRAAREARGIPRVVGTPTDHRRWLLTDVVTEGPHRRDTYRRLAEAVGARVQGPPRWTVRPDDPRPELPAGHVGLNAVSVSGAVREWPGFLALADRLGQPVVFYGGPGEEARVAAVAGPFPRAVGLSLPAFAGALQRCAVFVSVDSGAAHFAAAGGVPTVVVHGSTASEGTGPAGSFGVEPAAGPACRPCYRQRCRYGLECFDIPVEAVVERVREVLRAGPAQALGAR